MSCSIAHGQTIDKVYVKDSFEDSDLTLRWDNIEAIAGAVTRSDSVQADGNYSARIDITKSGTSIVRAEFVQQTEYRMQGMKRWYTFSVYIPSNWIYDKIYEVIFQLHETPDWSLGEDWRSPPIALLVDSNQFRVDIRSASAPLNTNATIDSAVFIRIGDINRGQWTHFKVYAELAYDNTGVLRIWKNGSLVLNRDHHPNYYNDLIGPFAKFGIYKPDWGSVNSSSIVTRRILYYDNVSISTHSGQKFYLKPSL
ncbi:MAG: polysaccharide lyase [Agriterribacter sp.]